jgi:aryl-alcohol dehydrogenase-like predicted oxidoreductase
MNYRKLGNSGLFVSEICFGVMSFTGSKGWTHIAKTNQKDANELTAAAIDNGVNFFDTADIYSSGVSEIMLGKALGKKRKDVIIGTKFGFRMENGENGDGLSRKRIIEACDASLKRLGTDYIDLYQIHSNDFITPIEETLGTLNTLVKQGKVRYTGFSNYYAWQIMKMQALAEKHNWEKFISNQANYSLLSRDLEYEQVDVCVDQGIGIIIWGPLHEGFLSGKYRDEKHWPKNSRIKKAGDLRPFEREKGEKIFAVADKISKERKVSIAQVSLNYLLRKKGVSSVIIGATNKKQLLENIDTSNWNLNEDEMKLLDETSQPPKIYPQWYFEIYRKTQLEKGQHQ